MKTRHLLVWRGTAVLAGATTLAIGATALTPGASMAASARTCPNKKMTLHIEGPQPETIPETIKAIKTEGGVSCTTAYKVIQGAVTGHPIPGYVSRPAKFKAPAGLVPELLVKGKKKIEYGAPGG